MLDDGHWLNLRHAGTCWQDLYHKAELSPEGSRESWQSGEGRLYRVLPDSSPMLLQQLLRVQTFNSFSSRAFHVWSLEPRTFLSKTCPFFFFYFRITNQIVWFPLPRNWGSTLEGEFMLYNWVTSWLLFAITEKYKWVWMWMCQEEVLGLGRGSVHKAFATQHDVLSSHQNHIKSGVITCACDANAFPVRWEWRQACSPVSLGHGSEQEAPPQTG